MALKRRAELILPPKKICVSPGGEVAKSMSNKLKVGAIEFDTDIYTPSQAEKFLAVKGYQDFGDCSELPGSLVFARKSIKLQPGSRKDLGKGVVALLGKAFKAEDEDEYDDSDELPIDASEDDVEDTEDSEDAPAEDEAIEIPEEEAAESPDEQLAEGESDDGNADSITQANDLVGAIVYFETLLEALPDMKSHPALAQTFAEIKQFAESMVQKLNDGFKEHHSDHALELMKQQLAAPASDAMPPEEMPDAPVDETPVDEAPMDGTPDMDVPMDETDDMDEDKIDKAKSLKDQKRFAAALEKCLGKVDRSVRKLSSVC